MDDTTQQAAPGVVVPPGMGQQQPVAQPAMPVSGLHKEHAPLTMEAPVAEYVQPTEVEPVLHPEVAEAGVEVVEQQERPQITVEQKAVGINHAPPVMPVTVAQPRTVTLPYTPQQVVALEKSTKVDESAHWLVMLTKYIMQKLQILGR